MDGRGYAPPGQPVVRRTHASNGGTRIRRSPTSRDELVSNCDVAQTQFIHGRLALYLSVPNDEVLLNERFYEVKRPSHESRLDEPPGELEHQTECNDSSSDGWDHTLGLFRSSLWGPCGKAGELCEEPVLVLGDAPQWAVLTVQVGWYPPRCNET